MKKIALVGSTGSIGRQTVEVVKRHSDKFKLVALIADRSDKALLKQVEELKPDFAVLTDKEAAKKITAVPDGVTFLCGEGAGLKALEECGADVALIACGGFAGLSYTLKAVEMNLPVALANKESLVCGGELLKPYMDGIVPIDSEHSAIWQCLNFDKNANFERLLITASGGAFRGKRWDELKEVTPAEALNHPTWNMGRKITIDSATLLNKGYEVIEAHYLFNCPFTKIRTVIHPQSVIHSAVQFSDGATVAQLSYPTMEIPIQIALTYPERVQTKVPSLDFDTLSALTFEPLERKNYPMYDLALTCGEEGGILPTALNAASEVAVNAFLDGQLSFTKIYSVAQKVVGGTKNCKVESLSQLCAEDMQARMRAKELLKKY